MTIAASPFNIFTFFLKACSPVNNEYLDGVHVADDECASVKRIPFAARASTLGVLTCVAP